MELSIGALREQADGEKRCALTPVIAAKFRELDAQLCLQNGIGETSQYPDSDYAEAQFKDDAAAVCKASTVLLAVQPPPPSVIHTLAPNSIYVGFLNAHKHADQIRALRDGEITAFAMELVPRISRAQSMDALSSQAAIAGYRAALKAATHLPRFFPMLTTAAGTIRPARVLVIGAGVAGLQAIATARRLGAQVEAFDVRSAAREQVESLGARFVDTGVSAEGKGGYARELTDEEKTQQQQALADKIAEVDAVISTAAVPGRAAPRIISAAMADSMRRGAVIIDLAAETGGNCELSEPGKLIRHGVITIDAPLDVPSETAQHASDMYARNLYNFLSPIVQQGAIRLDWDDEVYASTVVTREGKIVNDRIREAID